MAITQNTYTGNGSTVLFSFTFPYLETTDIKVSVNGTNTTAYTLANPTTVQFNAAPANGAAIRIYRQTDDAALASTFYPGSAIRSQDLNDNFTQNLYVTQESSNNAATATSTANSALTNSTTAINTANASTATANTALSNSQTALTQSAAAVSAANSASSSASSAVSTANSAAANAATALTNSQTALTQSANAVTTANQSSSTAGTALTNSQTALSQSSSAVTTAGTASSNASTALSNSQTALTQSASATSTANNALSTANAAASAVANAILYDTVANVAAIPASPANNDAVEVVNSTGIQSFTPLSGVPAGFVGDSGLSVRIVYTTTGATWNWIQYFPNDPENRYGDAITTLQGDVLGLDSAKLDATTAASTYLTQANAASTYQTQAGMSSYLTTSAAGTTYAPLASPTFTGTVTIPAGASIAGYLTTATASSTYQTQAGMSSYLTSAAASSTYAPQASPTFTGAPYVNGSYRGNVVAVGALDIDCSAGNYFTKTINANSTFTVSNVPSSRSYAFTLELTHTSGTVTWFSGVAWPGGTAPTLTTGKVHLFMFVTDDGGTTWRASSLINY